jgi:glycerate kinase
MKIIAAPTSFKGSLTSLDAARCIAESAKATFPEAEIIECPLSDGGEGFVDVLLTAGGKLLEAEVEGPLPEQKVHARWGILVDGKTAIVEMASAAGLSLVPAKMRDPKITTTFGVGQLIRIALDTGTKRVVIGIGGSATNDGGAGMAQALGARLLKKDGTEIGRGGAALLDLHQIDLSWLDRRIRKTEFVVASDVTNPLCGPNGASAVYGPQKGATPPDVELLDKALRHYADLIKRDVGIDVLEVPGSGAAGGMGAGCLTFLNARIQSGVEFVLDELRFNEKLPGTSLVITGEGSLDEQTRFGKALTGVVRRAKSFGIPVVAVAGNVEGDRKRLQEILGLEGLYSLRDANSGFSQRSVNEAMERAAELLKETVRKVLAEKF